MENKFVDSTQGSRQSAFYVVVRQTPASSGPDKNVRHEKYETALQRASELACQNSTPYIILVSMELVSPVNNVRVEEI